MTASLFVSTIVKSIMEGTGLSLEMAAPFGETTVQAALHCASSKGLPFSAACATFAAPIRTVAHVKIASLIVNTGILLMGILLMGISSYLGVPPISQSL